MNNNFESISQKENFKEKADILKSRVLKLVKKDPSIFWKMSEFGRILKSKHNNCLDFLAYHILIGSTPIGECKRFDFQGDDSVEKFLNSFES